ncbi:lipid-binding SYLF domain-containing protein [Candidatus Omnitrophota bacterium]
MVEKCGVILAEMQEMPDEGAPEDLMKKAEAIAIFPATISVGLGIGGKYGQGIIMTRDKRNKNWSSPAIFTLTGGSVGFQIGGEATDIILLIMDRASVESILHGKFKLGVDASVAVGPVGREAEASTDIQLKGGILSYSRSSGLYAGIKLEGVAITEQWDGNKALYGKEISAENILLNNKARMPKSAANLLKTLKKYPYKK